MLYDLKQGHAYAGLVFVGGFSYADVLGSAKGWAGTIRHNPQLWQAFNAFYSRCHPLLCCCMHSRGTGPCVTRVPWVRCFLP